MPFKLHGWLVVWSSAILTVDLVHHSQQFACICSAIVAHTIFGCCTMSMLLTTTYIYNYITTMHVYSILPGQLAAH